MNETSGKKKLELNDLEFVTGGDLWGYMTDAERAECYRLDQAVTDAYNAGDNELGEKLEEEYKAFNIKMYEKYGSR